MRLILDARPESAGQARLAATTFAREHGAINGTVGDIALAITEAVTNVVLHAYRDRSEVGRVTIEAGRDGNELRFLVCDDGPGVTPRADSPGLGLGLALIARVAAAMEIRTRESGGAEICMRFLLATG
jgi:serine/threonine-protein kinase RsbW